MESYDRFVVDEDLNSSSKIAQKFRSVQVSLQLNTKKTSWVIILRFLSQVRETFYTSKELIRIETTCTTGNPLKEWFNCHDFSPLNKNLGTHLSGWKPSV